MGALFSNDCPLMALRLYLGLLERTDFNPGLAACLAQTPTHEASCEHWRAISDNSHRQLAPRGDSLGTKISGCRAKSAQHLAVSVEHSTLVTVVGRKTGFSFKPEGCLVAQVG